MMDQSTICYAVTALVIALPIVASLIIPNQIEKDKKLFKGQILEENKITGREMDEVEINWELERRMKEKYPKMYEVIPNRKQLH